MNSNAPTPDDVYRALRMFLIGLMLLLFLRIASAVFHPGWPVAGPVPR